MNTRVLRVIGDFFNATRFKLLKLLSKLSHTILTLKSQIEKGLRKLGNKQENHLQQETEEISRRIGEPTVDPQPTPIGLENELQETEEISRKIGESTVTPQPTKPPNPIRVRKIGVATVTPQPKKPPRPLR